MLSETFDERLNQWFDPNYYERSNSKFTVKENGLELDCNVGNDSLKFCLESKSRLKYLKRKNVADVIILEFVEPEKIRLHIIECKTTVRSDGWIHIKKQFEGALLNILGVLGVLKLSEANIERIIFYTAFKEDKASSKQVQPVLLRKYKKQIYEWENDAIAILSLSNATHKKIQLDSSGKISMFL